MVWVDVKSLLLCDFNATFGFYHVPRQPVIIRGAMSHWPACGGTEEGAARSWRNLSYLMRAAGPRLVPFEIGASYMTEGWSQSLMTLKKFIEDHIGHGDGAASEKKPTAYLAQSRVFTVLPVYLTLIRYLSYLFVCCLSNFPGRGVVLVEAQSVFSRSRPKKPSLPVLACMRCGAIQYSRDYCDGN